MKSKISELHRLLFNYLKDYDILDQKIGTLTGPGEHYGSVILTVDLRVQSTKNGKEEKILNLVAKLIPTNEMLRKVFDVDVTFKKEILAYTVVIPTLVKFQMEYSVPTQKLFDNLFPFCPGARISANEHSDKVDDTGVLIFENLKSKGFFTEDRLRGYDTAAARLVIKDLARFHATPIALKLLKPKVFEETIKPCLVKNKGLEQVPEIAQTFHQSIMEGANDCPELEQYLEKIQNICDHPFPERSPPIKSWATILHSDFWTSNSMIQKDNDGNYIKSKIVDLQLLKYHSALKDLVFFLFTSVINDHLDKHFDDFVQIYYDNFIDTLRDFDVGLELFSWDNFQNELEICGKEEIYHILIMLKPICTERGMVKNTAEHFEDSDWTRKDLLGPNHRRKLRDTVLSLAKRNWL